MKNFIKISMGKAGKSYRRKIYTYDGFKRGRKGCLAKGGPMGSSWMDRYFRRGGHEW